MNDDSIRIVTELELDTLPTYALVAFAWRCAERGRAVLDESLSTTTRAVIDAIKVAEVFIAAPHSHSHILNMAIAAAEAAHNAAESLSSADHLRPFEAALVAEQRGDVLLREAHTSAIEEQIVGVLLLFIYLHSDFTIAIRQISTRRENLHAIAGF